jgi:hypothetical protein
MPLDRFFHSFLVPIFLTKIPGCHPACATLLRVRSASDAHLRDLTDPPVLVIGDAM